MSEANTARISLGENQLLASIALVVCGYFVLLLARQVFPEADLFLQICFITLLTPGILVVTAVQKKFKLKSNKVTVARRDVFVFFTAMTFFFASSNLGLLNMDRSRSFYVLSWVNSNAIEIQGGKLVFLGINSPEILNPQGIQLRLDEQENRGLIMRKSNKYSLTKFGYWVYQLTNMNGRLFKLENWKANTKINR